MILALIATLVIVASVPHTTARPSTGCTNNPADIVFILDSSTSIWRPDFFKQVEFVKNVTRQFDIGPGPSNTRVGVVTYGHEVWPQFNLKDNLNPDDMNTAISKLDHLYGLRTKTGEAIEYAVNHMFTRENGSRSDVTQIAIVITDGRSQRVWKTAEAAKAAHAAGIKVFAIGVGRRIDVEELRVIASDPDADYVFNVTSYNALLDFTQKFAEQTCRVTAAPPKEIPTPTPATFKDIHCWGKPADVFFIIDASSSITRKNFNKELDFVQKVVKMFDIGQTMTRVGAITFSNDAKMVLSLDNKLDKNSLLTEILRFKQPGGGTNTGEALRLLRQDGFARDIVRTGVARIAIVLTDGLSRNDEETADEAKMLHMSGVKTFAIGIGHGIDLIEIKSIASDPNDQYVYQVGDFNSLDSIKDILADKACSLVPDNIEEVHKDQPACEIKKNTDVMFVYDTTAIGEAQSNTISQFVASAVSRLDLQNGYLHVGRVTDNCPSGGNFALTSKWTPMDFSTIRHSNYSTLIKKVRRSGFSTEYGGREDARNVSIMFVDSGMDNLDASFLAESKALSKVSELFVVAIGQSPRISKFTAEFKSRNVLPIRSYVDLDTATDELLAKFCLHLQHLDYNIDYVLPV